MESLRNLALNAVPLNASIPPYFTEEVRIARIFKQLIIKGEISKKRLTNEEVQTMEFLKTGYIPVGWGGFKYFRILTSCEKSAFHIYVDEIRDTLQNMMINFGICKKCNNKLLFKSCGITKYAFSIERNEVVPVDKMDSGHFNYLTDTELLREHNNWISSIWLPTSFPAGGFERTAYHLVDAFPTVKPMVILRKKSIKINIGCSLQEFFELNKQWWGHDTTIDKKILQLYKSDIVFYVCTELTNSLVVELSIKSENIEQIKQMLSYCSWHIKTPTHIEKLYI
jgi:hypothetical protein